ncbi:MAG: alpha/beta hydrolase [Ilumatobacteraceae bacterium]
MQHLQRWSTIRTRCTFVICCCLFITACGSPSNNSGASTTLVIPDDTTPQFVPQAIEWKPCSDEATTSNVSCGFIEVPFDYGNPDQGSFVLFVKRRAAADATLRIGSLLVNPGGPGFGGSSLADDAEYYFSSTLLKYFDIIAWDPRGTGKSSPAVDCVDQYDQYFGLDSPPDTPEEKQALIDAGAAFDNKCEEGSGSILPYISTRSSATDINTIREALGEDKISYFGFSYGSELGATWATLFPNTVRAAVLDGSVDPNSTALEEGISQATGFEQQLNAFLANCAKTPSCAFYNRGYPDVALDDLLVAINAAPLVVSADRTPVTKGVMFTAIAQAMYSDSLWPQLDSALTLAQKGDGSGLLTLYDNYFQRKPDGTYGNELEAFVAISCLDDPGEASIEEIDASVKIFTDAAPRLGANFAYGYVCTNWPVAQVPKVKVTGNDAGPIVVIGTTGDPATPLEGTRNMAKALERGVLLIVEAQQHTGYGTNACIVDAVDAYLIKLTVPKNEMVCKS